MEFLILIGLLFAVILYCFTRGAYEDRKRKQLYELHLRGDYGHYEVRKYTPEKMQTVSRFYANQMLEGTHTFSLDDITWNDLNMDGIFALINHTQSSSGEEFLYDMLRRPVLMSKNCEQLEKHIQYLDSHEDERVRIQMALHELGNTGRYSLYDYLNFMDNLGNRSNRKHIAAIIALAVAAICISVSANLGIIAVLLVSCVNVVTYMKEKNTALPYLTSFAYIIRMLECGEELEKAPLEGLQEYKHELEDRLQKLTALHLNAGLIFKMNASTGNPIEVFFDYIKMLTHIDIIQFNRMVRLVRDNQKEIEQIAQSVGYLDAVIAIGAFRQSLPWWCAPALHDDRQVSMKIKEGYHPALKQAVANGFELKHGMLITGSNASGKSTFLKMTAINAILAQTIHTCAASSYEGGCYRIYSSMALRDNLDNGESYYIVEIKSLKRIMDAAARQEDSPLLCFIDEVLRGTNTVERIAASTQIMHQLSRQGVYCFAATHDIELTHMLEGDYDNYHFEEEVKDGDVLFSYRLLTGRAQSRNAIKLLDVIGFSKEITMQAQAMAEQFMISGQWEESYVR